MVFAIFQNDSKKKRGRPSKVNSEGVAGEGETEQSETSVKTDTKLENSTAETEQDAKVL